MAQVEKLSNSRSGYCHWQMLHIPYDSYTTWTLHNTCLLWPKCSVHAYYILTPHCDESIFNTDMWLSQKHCFIDRRCYTVPCKSHRGHSFHFYLYRVSELNTHKYLRERSERKYLYNYVHMSIMATDLQQCYKLAWIEADHQNLLLNSLAIQLAICMEVVEGKKFIINYTNIHTMKSKCTRSRHIG